MLLSSSCVYGLRASLYLAANQNGDYISIGEMSDKLDISFHFLTKTLQQLTNAGLMESQKGPKGGVRLTKKGSNITLYEVVEAIDGSDLFTECALGLPGCGREKPCPIHDQWADARDGIRDMLQETTLIELAEKGKNLNLRITADGSFEWG
ncbi:MAG: Rrf2 family transcriptional regulator [Balneolaceae bacterium]|nr:Rrf2 family transcriptional regulator [Balneolaceae bacterium]